MNKIEFALKLAKDCTYADEMTEGAKERLRNEIDEALKQVKNNIVLPDVSGRSELLIDFVQWLQKEYGVRKIYEMYADEYLKEKSINSH